MSDADASTRVSEGFPGQRLLVLPPDAVQRARSLAGTRHLHVTDAGYFPEAHRHGRARDRAIDQAVVLVVARGEGWCETPHGRFAAGPGDAVVLPPGAPHAYGADLDRPWTLWWLHLGGLDLQELLESAGMTEAAPVRRPAEPYGAIGLVDEILGRMEGDVTDAGRLAASGAAWHLMSLLASARTTVAENSEVIDAAARHIAAHLTQRLDIPALAQAANLSRSHFAALFKRQLGMTVLQYQTQLRMVRARELLDTTARSIGDVASAAGYEDAFYFTRAFRKANGVSPSAYRARART